MRWSKPPELIDRLGISPVLVDVGASGGPPEFWKSIAPNSLYIGFDPDLREMKTLKDGIFRKSVIINEAVGGPGAGGASEFILTESPFCSSTLEPDTEALSEYFIAPFFDVVARATVQVTTLEKVLDRLSLPAAHWLKVDSQGTDLRILNGLGQKLPGLLAADLEAGLIDIYRGEDLFPRVHEQMLRNGFWLADLNVVGAVRMRRKTRVALEKEGIGSGAVNASVRTSPGWCEARYLRTIAFLEERQAPLADYGLLWTFAMLTRQTGFALDLALACLDRFGSNEEVAVLMHRRSREAIRAGVLARLWPAVGPLNPFVPASIKRGIRRLLSS